MPDVTTRVSRFKPRTTEKVLCFTVRDFDILYFLYKYHLLTTHQLIEIHPGSAQKTRWRLRELFDAGFVHRFNTKTDATIPGSDPLVYALTDKGANWLSQNRLNIDRLAKRYNENNARRTLATIPHALMVSDIMMRFELASYYNSDHVEFAGQHEILARAPEQTRNRRSPTHWNSLVMVQGERHRIGNNPDQLFAITDKKRSEGRNTANFFLEADRGTESVRPTTKHLNKSTIYKKMIGYYNTQQHKLHQTVFGEEMRNFRVLWVIDSHGRGSDGKARIDNFLEVANEVTAGLIPELFLFTTYNAFKQSNPLSHEWVNTQRQGRKIINA